MSRIQQVTRRQWILASAVSAFAPSCAPSTPPVQRDPLPEPTAAAIPDDAILQAAFDDDIALLEKVGSRATKVTTADRRRLNPLHLAAAWGRLETVRLLLRFGADPNAPSAHGFTALHLSAPRGRWLVNSKTHPETTEVERSEAVATTVLQAGANVHALDWEGVTPLHMWSGGPSEGLGGVRLLLERGAEPNVAATEFRVTPLHLASSAGLARVVAELLAAQAQIDARNSIGQTPLHLASSFDRVEVVRILVEAGADRSIRDQDQETALSYARSPAARSLLEQAP